MTRAAQSFCIPLHVPAFLAHMIQGDNWENYAFKDGQPPYLELGKYWSRRTLGVSWHMTKKKEPFVANDIYLTLEQAI